jgi:peptidoglycan hydrolase CwlO-like protein
MTLSFIVLAQSVTGAVIFILALLLVAAIIGYVTAWFYAKSVYTPIIKGLEAEKADLLKQVAGLKEDVSKLNSKVDELNGTINGLNGKINKLEEAAAQKDKEIKELKSRIKE